MQTRIHYFLQHIKNYINDVKSGDFPNPGHTFFYTEGGSAEF